MERHFNMRIDKTEVFGFQAAIRGMRNPLNSWDKSDSGMDYLNNRFFLGNNDLKLAQKLINAGPEHSKFLRFITAYMDIEAPLYFWKEFDTYKYVEKNSCSTMHKILSRPLTKDDFEHEEWSTERENYLAYINNLIEEKQFRTVIQDLPSSYLQKRTIITNYAELRNRRRQRENHKLIEWHKVVKWIDELEYSELLK